jgi:hypothetical protein
MNPKPLETLKNLTIPLFMNDDFYLGAKVNEFLTYLCDLGEKITLKPERFAVIFSRRHG